LHDAVSKSSNRRFGKCKILLHNINSGDVDPPFR
jgi:hypothetical protein